jgi:hypothetical protein
MISPPISDAEVARLVRTYFRNDRLTLTGVGWAPVAHTVVNATTGGLYRVSGEAAADGQTRPWSLVLKVVQATPTSPDDPAHWNYWRREALAYQSGIPYGLAPGLTAPRLAGVVADEVNPARQYLLMEDVRPEGEQAWSLAGETGVRAHRLVDGGSGRSG